MEDIDNRTKRNYDAIKNEQDEDNFDYFARYKDIKRKYLKIKKIRDRSLTGGYSYDNLDTTNPVDTTSGSRAVFDTNGEVIHKQMGGDTDQDNFMKSDAFKDLIKSTKNKVTMTIPLDRYDYFIKIFEDHCKNKRLSADQIRSNLIEIFRVLGDDLVRSVGLTDKVSKNYYTVILSEYNKQICENINIIINRLKKQQNLQLGLLMLLSNINDGKTINIDDYMHFAREYSYTDDKDKRIKLSLIDSVKLETGKFDEIAVLNLLRTYKQFSEYRNNIWRERADTISRHLQYVESNLATYKTILTKHGHTCLQPCYEHKSIFGSKTYRCPTDEYKSGLRKKKYDECIVDNSAIKNKK